MKLKHSVLAIMFFSGASASAQNLGIVNLSDKQPTIISNDHYTKVKESCFAGVDVEDKNGALTVKEYIRLANRQEVLLREGDIIRSVAGISVATKKEWDNTMDKLKPGETVQVNIEREGKSMSVPVKLEKIDVFAKEI